MKFGLTNKLLLALIGSNVLLVVIMAAAAQWGFQHGFLDYLHRAELGELTPLANALKTAYREHGNWDFLRRRPRVWRQYHRYLPHPNINQRNTVAARLGPAPPPVGAASGVNARLRLLDARGNLVIGPPDELGNALLRPIKLDGKIIGQLSLTPLKLPGEGLEQRFRNEQNQVFLWAAASALLLSLLLAVALGRYFLSPIRKLTRGARALAGGHYATRIPDGPQDELGELGRDFNQLADVLERNEKLRRLAMADISHELRTPLAVLRGEIEALQDGIRECDAARLTSLHNGVMNLSRLVDDLYELALSDAGALSYHKEPFDAKILLEDALDEGEHILVQKRITLMRDLPDDAPILADPRRLRQVFDNLLKNSARYTNAGGTLRVSCRRTGDRIAIDFQDSVPGVPATSLPRLFERFFRVEGSRDRARGGAGLGLAICRNIVEEHQGTITAESSLLGGLWIRITLPAAKQP